MRNFIAFPVDISTQRLQESQSKIQLYQTISGLAELRDKETGNHMRRVGIFAKLLAKAYGMPARYCDDVEIFAPMHDISILLAERKLTSTEFEIIKTHTVLGYNIVKGKKELEMVAAITLSHHERWDGTGYPNGLAGEDIPLSARITAIADVYDALRSTRPYKPAWPHAHAVEEIRLHAGTHFDPGLVPLFLALGARFESVYSGLIDR